MTVLKQNEQHNAEGDASATPSSLASHQIHRGAHFAFSFGMMNQHI